jgi:tryptophanyl-tRNA synthetase
MNIDDSFPFRIISGFRPLRGLHVAHHAAVLRDVCKYQYAQKRCAYVFVADHHARSRWDERVDFANIGKRTREIAKQLLACGIDPEFSVLYRQSDIPELFEIMWFIAGVVADSTLRRGHAVTSDPAPTAGIYLYPLLMVADILSLKATNVAVGKDQKQHLEMARDVARKLIRRFGSKFLPIPESLSVDPPLILGIDSSEDRPKKMGSEFNNDIPLFADEDTVKDRIEKILTRPIKWGDLLPTEGCNILHCASAMAGEAAKELFARKYEAGGYGYSDAKKELIDLFFDHFGSMRQRYAEIEDAEVDRILHSGAMAAREQIARLVFEVRREVATLV